MSDDYNSEFDDPLAEEMSPFEEMSAEDVLDEGDVFSQDTEGEADAAAQGPKYRRPRIDLYTLLLVLTLVFIVVATVIHYYECTPYEYGSPSYKTSSTPLPPPVRN